MPKSSAPPPVFAYITQGKTEHMATIIDPKFLMMLQKKKDFKSKSDCLSTLKKKSDILIKWHSTGGKEPVEVSSVRLVDGDEREETGRRGSRRGSTQNPAAASTTTTKSKVAASKPKSKKATQKVATRRGRKRPLEIEFAPITAVGMTSTSTLTASAVDVIEILDDDDDDDENLNVKPAAIENSKPRGKQFLDQTDIKNRKAPPAAAGKKAPPVAAAHVEVDPQTMAFIRVLEIVPNVEEVFLKNKLREQKYNIEIVVAILLESDYPKQTKPISINIPAATNHNKKSAAVVVRGRKSIAPKYDYSSPTSFQPSDEYKSQVKELLLYDFGFFKKNTVKSLLLKNHGRYTLTRNHIQDVIIGNSSKDKDVKGVAAAAGSDAAGKAEKLENQHYQTLKAILIRGRISDEVKQRINIDMPCTLLPKKKIGVAAPTIKDPVLEDEHRHYEKKFKEWKDKIQNRLRRETNRKFSVENGSSVTCGICYDDVAKEECVPCKKNGHLFCRDCIIQYAESQIFGSGNLGIDQETKKPALEIKCCDSGGCKSGFGDKQLQNALPRKIWEKYLELQTTAQIQQAGLLGNVSTCPKCGYQAELAETQMVFECPVQDCQFSSCKKCGKASHIPLRCEEVAQQKRQDDGRLKIEEALSEAKMRICPRCKKKFIKSDGCNRMTCACGMKICYMCNTSLDATYSHFCQTPHCDHSSCGKCKLYTNDEEDDAQAMRDAGLAAKKEYEENIQKEGGKGATTKVQLDVDQIMHDPSQRRQRQPPQPQPHQRRQRVAERLVTQAQRRQMEAIQLAHRRAAQRDQHVHLAVAAARRNRDAQIERQQAQARRLLANARAARN
mmetsp:Transcript_51298/g.58125  ORF Transcript_51298/g.58125 Transcript_51298/m.58125 type:complete len:839 (-) Transcript_51298:69-2585(-)